MRIYYARLVFYWPKLPSNKIGNEMINEIGWYIITWLSYTLQGWLSFVVTWNHSSTFEALSNLRRKSVYVMSSLAINEQALVAISELCQWQLSSFRYFLAPSPTNTVEGCKQYCCKTFTRSSLLTTCNSLSCSEDFLATEKNTVIQHKTISVTLFVTFWKREGNPFSYIQYIF